jgi:hypothetical protein
MTVMAACQGGYLLLAWRIVGSTVVAANAVGLCNATLAVQRPALLMNACALPASTAALMFNGGIEGATTIK